MTSVKPRRYSQAERAKINRLKDEGMEIKHLAEMYNTTPKLLRDNISRWKRYEEKPKPDQKAVASALGVHLVDYHRARRGFHVPAHLNDEYTDLLKTGVSIVEAGRQLGLVSVTDRS